MYNAEMNVQEEEGIPRGKYIILILAIAIKLIQYYHKINF